MMGPSEGGEDFLVEEPDAAVYNLSGADPPLWQPRPQDILTMFQQLEDSQVLPLKWTCPGRRLPEMEASEQPLDYLSDEEDDAEDKNEEKRPPEPSAFDFDDTASEFSSKVKLTPRTPAKAKRPEKKVARMDNILNSIKRQQKAEREARKSQARTMRGGSGTPSRMGAAGFSPAASPRLLTSTVSPGPSSPRGSPRTLGVASGSPAAQGQGESAATSRPVTSESTSVSSATNTATASKTSESSPPGGGGSGEATTTPLVSMATTSAGSSDATSSVGQVGTPVTAGGSSVTSMANAGAKSSSVSEVKTETVSKEMADSAGNGTKQT